MAIPLQEISVLVAEKDAEKDAGQPNVAVMTDVSDDDEYKEIYNHFSHTWKVCITTIVTLGAFNANLGGQLILPAMPEIADTFHTTGTMINISNALYQFFMGFSTLFSGPISQIFGRRWLAIGSGFLFFAFSVGSALSPNLASLFVFRTLTALLGTGFHVVGSSCISDIYKPTERGTALGFYISGSLVAPSMGPFLGGVIVTYESWRALFWFQAALGGLAFVLSIFFLPETGHHKRLDELQGLEWKTKTKVVLQWLNPLRVFVLLFRIRIFLVSISAAAIIWNMQTLLTPIRYVINPRFHLETPLQSSFFYLAPGAGYILGTFLGGPWADYTVKRWIRKRGKRIPEDRLRSAFGAMGLVIPGSILIYGWAIEKEKGGIPLPVICMFVQGLAQMICLPSVNTYFLEVDKPRAAEVMAISLFFRFAIGAIGAGACLPGIQAIGAGWMSTITSLFVMASTVCLCITVYFLQSDRDQRPEDTPE